VQNYLWDFGDGKQGNSVNAQHQYALTGNYKIWLTALSDKGCADSVSGNTTVWNLPVPDLTSDIVEGCPPLTVNFQDKSTVVDGSIQDVLWHFGNGNSASGLTSHNVYLHGGNYDVTVVATSTLGCKADSVFPEYIYVYPDPVADFSFSPETLSIFDPSAQFSDRSSNAVSWLWDLDDSATSVLRNPEHSYPGPASYHVQLIITTAEGCIDTTEKILLYEDQIAVWAPTAFTPNHDGKNDVFKVNGVNISTFTLVVFNRWGQTLFASDNPETGWDGTFNNADMPAGVYAYQLSYRDQKRRNQVYKGSISLIR
jgi:gliding motility-associated-like protein